MSLSRASLHSATTGLTLPAVRPMSGSAASAWRTRPSNAAPMLSVFVSAIGVSMFPSSCTCVEPAALP